MCEREYKNYNENELPAPSSTNSRRRRRKEVGERGSWKSKWELRKNLWLRGGAGKQIRRSVGIENVDRTPTYVILSLPLPVIE
jgi:hypothetical protein